MPRPSPKVGLVLTGLIDDWLQSLGRTVNDFTDVMMGSWCFNYAESLRRIDVDCVFFTVARGVTAPVRRTHAPTGAGIWFLPAPSVFARAVAPVRWLDRAGLISHRLGGRLYNGLADQLATPASLLEQAIHDEQCTAVLVQEYESGRFGACTRMSSRLGIPVYGTFTGRAERPGWLRPFRLPALRRAAGLVICSSREIARVRDRYRVPAEKILKLAYPVEPAVWYPEPRETARARIGVSADPVIVIYHGNIDFHVKGIDVLLDAWSATTPVAAPASRQLLIVGDGKDADRLERELRERHRTDVLFRRGWISDRALLRQYLSAADVYVFPSRNDAFGIALVEAMACGLPVIASDARGIPDILPDGEASGGIIVPPGDDRALAAALDRLLRDGALRARLGSHARRRASQPCFDPSIAHELARFLSAAGSAPTTQ